MVGKIAGSCLWGKWSDLSSLGEYRRWNQGCESKLFGPRLMVEIKLSAGRNIVMVGLTH